MTVYVLVEIIGGEIMEIQVSKNGDKLEKKKEKMIEENTIKGVHDPAHYADVFTREVE